MTFTSVRAELLTDALLMGKWSVQGTFVIPLFHDLTSLVQVKQGMWSLINDRKHPHNELSMNMDQPKCNQKGGYNCILHKFLVLIVYSGSSDCLFSAFWFTQTFVSSSPKCLLHHYNEGCILHLVYITQYYNCNELLIFFIILHIKCWSVFLVIDCVEISRTLTPMILICNRLIAIIY